MLLPTINKKLSIFFFLLFSSCLFSQDTTYTKLHKDSLRFLETATFNLGKLTIIKNDFYYKEKKLTRSTLLNLINTQNNTYVIDKVKTSENINLFYKFKNNKNISPILASSSFILGSLFSFLTIREGGSSDAVIVGGIFGGVTLGFISSGIINNIKFIIKKRELSKQISL